MSKHIPSQLAGEGGPKGRVGGSEPSPAWKWLGIVLVDLGEGAATVEMTPSEDMANHAGFVHGGMITALADSAMGRSLRTLVPGVARAMSFDLKLNFISAAKVGEKLVATGHVVHAGRRTAVTECRVEAAGGRLVATASGTFAITREKGITVGSNAD
ncbi:MAG: PaaI family thioesterase [Chloroflexi bacterium]|nr:MAG: PaaI family thioesterase [Chloroflexota bacterium]TME53141.1 MAG: PaaI family thioesterase [Chloroflexota bacterium]